MKLVVYAVRDLTANSQFVKMVAARKACEAAGVEMPEAVEAYLNTVCEDGADLLFDVMLERAGARDLNYNCPSDCEWALSPYRAGGSHGYEVDLSKLPSWVSKLRFVGEY